MYPDYSTGMTLPTALDLELLRDSVTSVAPVPIQCLAHSSWSINVCWIKGFLGSSCQVCAFFIQQMSTDSKIRWHCLWMILHSKRYLDFSQLHAILWFDKHLILEYDIVLKNLISGSHPRCTMYWIWGSLCLSFHRCKMRIIMVVIGCCEN